MNGLRKIDTRQTPCTIYCIRLRGGYFYVGRTTNLERRLTEHETTPTAAWIKLHPMLHLEQKWENCDIWDEDKIVKRLMHQYGIDHVRGGSYSQPNLNPEQLTALKREIIGATDACYKCGKAGHFTRDCGTTE